MKAYSKSGAVPPPILNLVLDDTSGQPHAPSALLRKMGPHHGLGGLQSLSECFGEEKASCRHDLAEIQTPDCPACSLVTSLIVLSRLLC
jgi:hypothetical protein